MLASPGRGKPYMMLPGISASMEAEPLRHTLHNQGQAQLQPDGVRAPPSPRDCSPQGSGCPSLPNRTAHAPHCEGTSQRYREGCWPRGDQLLYQFPVSCLPSSSRTQLVQNLSIPPLSPFYFLPYSFPMACIQPCKLTFCDKHAYTL